MTAEGVRAIGSSVTDRLLTRVHFLDNASRMRDYVEQNGQEITERLQQYADMIDRLNVFLSGENPHVILFRHILNLRNKLLTIGLTRLPRVVEMQQDPSFMWSFGRGFNRAIEMMINGHEHSYGVGSHPNADRVDVTAKREVSEKNLVIGGMAHILEQTYIAWLKKKGLVLTKDEILGAIDEATRSTFPGDDESPLVRPFMQLGWIKKDSISTMIRNGEQLDALLAARSPEKVYERKSHYKAPVEVHSAADIKLDGPHDLGFAEMHSLGTFVSGNALFHIIRNELYRESEGGYHENSFYEVEVLAAHDMVEGVVFNTGAYEEPQDKHPFVTLFFYYNGETETDGVVMHQTRDPRVEIHDYEGRMVRRLGSSPAEISRIVSERIRQNPIHTYILPR